MFPSRKCLPCSDQWLEIDTIQSFPRLPLEPRYLADRVQVLHRSRRRKPRDRFPVHLVNKKVRSSLASVLHSGKFARLAAPTRRVRAHPYPDVHEIVHSLFVKSSRRGRNPVAGNRHETHLYIGLALKP